MIGSAAFFEPLARTVPCKATPPVMSKCGMKYLYFFSTTQILRILDLVAVALEIERTRGRAFVLSAGRGVLQLELRVNHHAVVPHFDLGVGDLLPILVLRRGELHVVRLPSQRRKAHVHVRLAQLIEAAALVVLAFQPERIEHLDLVAVVQIHAAVAPPLLAGERHVRQAELDVQRVVAEALLAGRLRQQVLVLQQRAVLEVLGRRAVEEHGGPLGRLAPSVGL